MDMFDKPTLEKIRSVLLEVDPNEIIMDAQSAGLDVKSIEDFKDYVHDYWRLDEIADIYIRRTARWCAVSGATTSVGGFVTSLTLGVGDAAHMTARLFNLCQRLSLLHGFDPEQQIQKERNLEIFLSALGFDRVAQMELKEQLKEVVLFAGKKVPRSNYMMKLVALVVAKLTGKRISTRAISRFVPVVGAVAGGTLNYFYILNTAKRMKEFYQKDYLMNKDLKVDI